MPIGDENDEFQVSGAIRCSCGSERFHILIYADTENGYPQVRDYKGDTALVIKAVCTDCEKDYFLFDAAQHGWNSFACPEGISVPDEELESWSCPKCSGESFHIEMKISSQGKEDFIDETGIAGGESDFEEADWVNAFSWIVIGLKCSACGHTDEEWIDYETM